MVESTSEHLSICNDHSIGDARTAILCRGYRGLYGVDAVQSILGGGAGPGERIRVAPIFIDGAWGGSRGP